MLSAKAIVPLRTIYHKGSFRPKKAGQLSSIYLVKRSCIGETAFPYFIDHPGSMQVVFAVWPGS